MSDSPDTPTGAPSEREVLSKLPRRRPQRLTARREATRSQQAKTPAKGSAAKQAKPARKQPARTARAATSEPRPAPSPITQRAPRQGFASDEQPSGRGFAPSEPIFLALRLLGGASASGLRAGAQLLGGAIARIGRR